jgi:ABC-2 type transport system permease protein
VDAVNDLRATGTTGAATEVVGRSAAPASAPSAPVWLAPLSLARRELVRFLRQRHRVIGALATPVVFWLLVGAGMGRSFQASGLPDGENYLQYFFPGTVLMILLFTAIFSTISIIEDRREGFLQSVLVAPVPRSAIVLGKVLGGTVLAFGQAVLFLLLGPLVGVRPSPAGAALALGLMALIALALAALGFCIAWRMSSTQGFHAVMNLFLMPMWFLSGALFPVHNASAPLRWVMRLNPLTYGLGGLRRALYLGTPGDAPTGGLITNEITVAFIVTAAFAAVMLALGAAVARAPVAGDLQ